MTTVTGEHRLSTRQWRELSRATTEAYLAPNFRRRDASDVGIRSRIPRDVYFADPGTVFKAERHAAAAAYSRLVTQELIAGEGAEARFASRYTRRIAINPEYPMTSLQYALVTMFNRAADRLNRPVGLLRRPYSQTEAYLDLYDGFADMWPPHKEQTVSRKTLREGNTFPGELAGFVALTSELFPADPQTKHLGKEGRVALAHRLVPLMLGRASMHGSALPFVPDWGEAGANARMKVKPNGTPTLVDGVGATLFSHAIRYANVDSATPNLMCPAHQPRPNSEDTDLMAQMHAGVNLAADLGFYD